MKSSLTLLGVLLLTILSLTAQQPTTPQPIPELQEWWRAPADEKGLGQYGVSYIPNFYHGKDAMGVSIKSGQMETWLNRFPGDRENIFTWKGGGPVLQGDFNGDGITDYLGAAIVYRGVKNGEPPDSIPVQTLTISPNMIADVNHDGYDDIIQWIGGGGRRSGGLIGQVAYGAADFKDMKVVPFQCGISMDSTMEMERMYMGADGDMRTLMFSYTLLNDPRSQFSGYVLFRANWKTGETLPTFEKLSSVIRERSKEIGFQRGGAVYQSKYHSNVYFIAKEYLDISKNNVLIYDISKDTFEQKLKFRMDNVWPFMLNRSLDTDKYEDWMMYVGTTKSRLYFFSGSNILDSIPMSMHDPVCEGNLDKAQVIGDVNGDSVNDVVVYLESSVAPNCLRILLGPKSTTGVQESSSETNTHFSLGDPTPHPLLRDKAATLTARIPTGGVYVLEVLSITGAKVEEVSRQNMSAGEQTITVDCSHSQVSNGTYILRLSNEQGNVVGQRLIVIQ